MAQEKVVKQGAFIAVLIIAIIIILILGVTTGVSLFLWRRDRGELQNNVCPSVN